MLGLVVLAVVGLVGWLLLGRHRRPRSNTREALAAWEATACPVCVAFGGLADAAAINMTEGQDETSHVQL